MDSAVERAAGAFLSDWSIRFVAAHAAAGRGTLLWSDPSGTAVSRLPDGRIEIGLTGLLSVLLDSEKRIAEVARLSADATPQTVRHFWVAQVAPRLVASASRLVLHGGVLQRMGRSALFLGPSGIGKSTLSASLSRAGWRLAGDDAAVVTFQDGCWMAGSVDPSLRLRQDSADALIGDSAPTEPVASYSAKRRVLLADTNAAPLPLAAIFLLQEGPDVATSALAPGRACMTLIENAFRLDPSDAASAADALALAARVVQAIPCSQLVYPRRYESLDAVRRCIENALDGDMPSERIAACG